MQSFLYDCAINNVRVGVLHAMSGDKANVAQVTCSGLHFRHRIIVLRDLKFSQVCSSSFKSS
jgi:hypothetical protein